MLDYRRDEITFATCGVRLKERNATVRLDWSDLPPDRRRWQIRKDRLMGSLRLCLYLSLFSFVSTCIAVIGAKCFAAMSLTFLLDRNQIDLLLSSQQYKFYLEVAAVVVLLYAAVVDFLTFKIRNSVVLL
ncbi:MAG: hypothetical protein WBG18_18230, partial [Xanthobacteraceae bacterium]